MNKTLKIIITVIIVAFIVWIIATKGEKPTSNAPIKIGVSTLLSGDWAALGENIVNTAKLAVQEINSEGGVNGRQIELLVEDAGYDSKTGLSAAQKLVNIDGVTYIIGGTSSNGTLAAAALVNEKKVPYITPVTGGRNIDEAGEYIFRNANSDILAGRDLANAMIKLGYTKIGIVSEVTEYTLDIKKTFEQTIKEKGGVVVVSEEFQPNTKDYRTLIEKVKSGKPQALLILSQLGTNAAQFIKQSRELGYNPPLFTDFTFATNDNAKKIAGSFDGIYFADPAYASENPTTVAFFDLYQKTYGSPSVIPFHAAATYDAVMMYAEALKAVGDNSEKVHDWLLSHVKKYHGLMGTYSFDEKGNSDLGFTVKIIKNGKPEPIEVK